VVPAEAKVIVGLREIADRFDHVLLDQWGALHEGRAVFPAAREAVLNLHRLGKRILVLSNSGKRAADNEKRLTDLGLERDAYDGVLSSGEVTWIGLQDRKAVPFCDLGHACFLISRGKDRSVIDGLGIDVVDVAQADFILLSGLDDTGADLENWRPILDTGIARRLPMLCANPDLTMFDAKGGLVPAPGALARLYEQMGGTVAYAGKPHAPIFAGALAKLGNPDPARVIVIGDSIDHDVAGGRAAGMLTLLLAAGVHKDRLLGAADMSAAARALAGGDAGAPHWLMQRLIW
jgi:HAD superfamily hydrolase (TIGR01459 family)